MTCCPIQLGQELSESLKKYMPVKSVVTAYQLKRREQIKKSMQKIRDARRSIGLNANGRIYGSPKPKK
jgi:hypothetical protein